MIEPQWSYVLNLIAAVTGGLWAICGIAMFCNRRTTDVAREVMQNPLAFPSLVLVPAFLTALEHF